MWAAPTPVGSRARRTPAPPQEQYRPTAARPPIVSVTEPRAYADRMPVLGTKLHLPLPRRRLVQRSRLLERLEARGGESPRLVLVAAPAGFGKTTLLTQW